MAARASGVAANLSPTSDKTDFRNRFKTIGEGRRTLRITMPDSTTLIVTATPNPNEAEAMQAYLKGVLPLFMGAGGTLVKRQKITDVIGGDKSYGLILVMDFESKDAVTKMFASDDYAALIPSRDQGFSSLTISLASEM
jgi:uncharacterized protein (DUF1330 family)